MSDKRAKTIIECLCDLGSDEYSNRHSIGCPFYRPAMRPTSWPWNPYPQVVPDDTGDKLCVSEVDKMRDNIKEYIEARSNAQENYIACYLKETGLSVLDVILVEEKSSDGMLTRWYCEPKAKSTR